MTVLIGDILLFLLHNALMKWKLISFCHITKFLGESCFDKHLKGRYFDVRFFW